MYLTPFISDIDNDSSDLTVWSHSNYQTNVQGHTITFNYPNGVLLENVRVYVSDSLLTDYCDFNMSVTPVNDPPEINGVPNQTCVEDQPKAFDVTQYLSDVDNSINQLIVTENSQYVTVSVRVPLEFTL